MKIVALDPGGTTGYAYRDGAAFGCGEIEGGEQSVWWALERLAPNVVVCERFNFRPKDHADLTAVAVIAIAGEWCRQHEVPMHLQTVEAAKHFWNDERLREYGVYRAGGPHARDATRHLLWWEHFNTNGPRLPIQIPPQPAQEAQRRPEDPLVGTEG